MKSNHKTMKLEDYKKAGVKSFTVQNGNAIADNPYEADKNTSLMSKKRFNDFNLPPLPTSGIPDGPVSIEDVEEQTQWLCSDGKWYVCMGLIRDYKQSIRTALVPKKVETGVEGIDTLEYIKQIIAEKYDCYNWQDLFFNSRMRADGVPDHTSLWEEVARDYAESQLAQYKEKVIAKLEADLKSKSHYVINYRDGLQDAIDLIKITL